MKIQLKYNGISFAPHVQDDRQRAYLDKLDRSKWVDADIKTPRNPKFHRKFFALMNYAFEIWPDPESVEYRGEMIQPEKNFEQFREWVTVMAGYYDVVGYPDGSFKFRAKSISFAAMDDEEFGELYNAVINVILEKVVRLTPPEHWEQHTNNILNFD